MDSPDRDCLQAASSAEEDSPITFYLNSLSPLEQVKAVPCTQRFKEIDFSSPPPVFKSPHSDLQRETSFLKREKIDGGHSVVYGESHNQLKPILVPYSQKEVQSACADANEQTKRQLNPILIPCSQQEDHSHSSSKCVDEYLVDPDDVVDSPNSLQVQAARDGPHLSQSDLTGTEEIVPKIGEQYIAQTISGLRKEWDDNYLGFLESFRSVEAYENTTESLEISVGPAEEVDWNQRAIRRHLQFGAAMMCKGDTTSRMDDQSSQTKAVSNSKLPSKNLKDLIPSSHIESIRISGSLKPVSHHYTITSTSLLCPSEFVGSTGNIGDLPVPDFAPSSIGSQSDMFESHNLANYSNVNSITAIAEKINGHMDDAEQETHAVEAATSASSSVADRFGELNKESSQRKRQRVTETSEREGCKRCNCKRSKCLKLYCECFAAGVYCVDDCACTECFNKPEHEKTVLDKRQQIESRNPVAFAPKIVKCVTDSPANLVEDGNQTTPSSARHIRGCNCKKSKCLKKYCECFEARVGCSSGCRCEGCNNPFGKKADLRALLLHNAGVTGAKRLENPCRQKFDTKKTVTAELIKTERVQHSTNWEELANKIPETPPASHHIHPNGILKNTDTPQILGVPSTPTMAVKAHSPNKKRVSPSQNRPRGSTSSYLPRLRRGRKFILQSMPSFPPLTPHSKSKEYFDGNEEERGGSNSSQ